jgi:hypothetical protein
MTAIHVVNGQAVRSGGLNNYANGNNPTGTKMSCLYCNLLVSSTVGYSFGLINIAQTFSDVPQPSPSVGSNAWAIGGFSLMLDQTITSTSDMSSKFISLYGSALANSTWLPGMYDGRARTFIGYTSDYKVLFGVLAPGFSTSSITDSSVEYFDMYTIVKNRLSCVRALSVDGGGSSKVKYKDTSGNVYEAEVENRNVLCQLALTTSAESNCTWNG